MEKTSTSIEPVLPRTANLLACKQWWRVCFLYGDQQKYYRQVYSKAAAQRLALSNKAKKSAAMMTTTTEATTTPPPLFPKQQTIPSTQRRTKKSMKSLRNAGNEEDHDDYNNNRSTISKEPSKKKNEEVTNNAAKVTILDDPFLFGIDDIADISPAQLNEATEQYIKTYFDGSTSTIIDSMQLPQLPPKSTATLDRHCITSRNHDLLISENDLKFLNLTLRKRTKGGGFGGLGDTTTFDADSRNFTSINDISFTFNENNDREITE